MLDNISVSGFPDVYVPSVPPAPPGVVTTDTPGESPVTAVSPDVTPVALIAPVDTDVTPVAPVSPDELVAHVLL